MEGTKGKTTIFGCVCSIFSIVCIPYFLYLIFQYPTFRQNYNLFPVLIGKVLVLPLFCMAVSYSLLWWCRKIVIVTIKSEKAKRHLLVLSVLFFLAYYVLAIGYLVGWLSPSSFLAFIPEHAYLAFFVGILLYLGLASEK